MALGGTIRGVYGCVMHILLPGFNGLENIVDHQAFLIITHAICYFTILARMMFMILHENADFYADDDDDDDNEDDDDDDDGDNDEDDDEDSVGGARGVECRQ